MGGNDEVSSNLNQGTENTTLFSERVSSLHLQPLLVILISVHYSEKCTTMALCSSGCQEFES